MLRWLCLSICVFGLGTLPGVAQDASPEPDKNNEKSEAKQTPLGGQSAMDMIRIEGIVLNVPLRNAGIVPESDELELDGRKLVRGKDYTLDNGTGVVMLFTSVKEGSTLRARYRFDKTLAKSASTSSGNALTDLKLSFAPGAVGSMSLGMVDRKANGAVMQSDLYSLRTNFKGGSLGFGMNGVVALSNQKQINSASLMGSKSGKGDDPTGEKTAIVQALRANIGGAKLEVDYQDIESGFSGASAFKDAGYDDATIQSLMRENGLKRMGYRISDLNLGGLKFNQSFNEVGDSDASVVRRSYGVDTSGMKLGFNSRKVDGNFKRWKDLREDDRMALEHERGLTTDEWFADLSNKKMGFKLQSKAVENAQSKGFSRTDLEFKSQKFNLSYGTQKVDQGFSQLRGTREAQWQQLAREQGLSRTQFSLQTGPITSQLSKLDFGQSSIKSAEGRFNAMDLSMVGKTWSIEHFSRSFDEGFTHANRMSDPEAMSHMQTIAKMYEPTGVGVDGKQRHWFNQSAGISRSLTRLAFAPGAGIGVRFDHLELGKGADNSTFSELLTVTTPTLEAGYKHTSLAANLDSRQKLMDFEKQRLGVIEGLTRTDSWLKTKLGKGTLSFSTLRGQRGVDEVERDQVSYSTPGFSLAYNRRSVSDQFHAVGDLIDPERELLRNMVGQEQRQIQLDWMMRKNLNVKLDWSDNAVKSLGLSGHANHSFMQWAPDKFTKLELYKLDHQQRDSNEIVFDHQIDRMLFSRTLPKFGSFQYEQERHRFEGENTPNDSLRSTVIVEGQVTSDTKIRTEQTKTRFENGDTEKISANTIETKVTPKAGVSVSDTSISRIGARPSERKRNYGIWLDLGNNVRLQYGYKRDLNSQANGYLNSQFSMTGGTVGGLNFGGANYNTERWDNARHRSLGNFSVSSSKPMSFGPVKDFKFNLATDTLRDHDFWHREQNLGSFTGKLFGSELTFDYLSQYVPQQRNRAVDRAFRFAVGNTPTSKFQADVSYKLRTLPNDQEFSIRKFNFVAKPFAGYELSHTVQTYPETNRPDVLLGSVLQPIRSAEWKFKQTSKDLNTLFGMSWREDLNEQHRRMTRLVSVDATFFAKNPSPLSLSYGLEQSDQGSKRTSIHRYSISYMQRPGPNQAFSLQFGNVSWQHGRSDQIRRENWSMRLDWQIRF